MPTNRCTLKWQRCKTILSLHLITKLLLVFVIGWIFFSGCTGLKEASQRREARLKKQRDEQYLMLTPSKGEVQVAEDARTAGSAHYSITFAEDLKDQENFDEVSDRSEFMQSALGYMESLYNEMNTVFGFQPEHKIHVTLHNVYSGTTSVATTTTQYRYESRGNTSLKFVTGIKMDFPIAMYEKPTTRVHELTHAFTNIYFLPTWFNEGIAVLMETEWAKGGSHPKFDSLETNLKRNMDGINDLEDWASHGGNPKAHPVAISLRLYHRFRTSKEVWTRFLYQSLSTDGCRPAPQQITHKDVNKLPRLLSQSSRRNRLSTLLYGPCLQCPEVNKSTYP